MSEGVGDPVIQEPLVLEGEDGQEEILVDILQALSQGKRLGVQPLRYERLELIRSLHLGITSYLLLL